VDKVLKWPELKPEDNVNLHKFSILLVCCKNVMDGNDFMTKFDNPASCRNYRLVCDADGAEM
jgi:hypothetical protein